MIEDFFHRIEKLWRPTNQEPIVLNIIGSIALFLQTNYIRGTKDMDILKINDLSKEIWEQLKTIAGKGSDLAQSCRLYVDLVGSGFPFMPPKPLFHPLDNLNKAFKFFSLQALDPLDVVISKLKTFRPNDLDDIRAMAERHLLNPDRLVERFELAKEHWLIGSRAPELRDYIEHLHVVQRDYLLVKQTVINLPDWLESL